jgi:hypothetical protein
VVKKASLDMVKETGLDVIEKAGLDAIEKAGLDVVEKVALAFFFKNTLGGEKLEYSRQNSSETLSLLNAVKSIYCADSTFS